jgi:hypothetical protein
LSITLSAFAKRKKKKKIKPASRFAPINLTFCLEKQNPKGDRISKGNEYRSKGKIKEILRSVQIGLYSLT